jgi:hypothetical protein
MIQRHRHLLLLPLLFAIAAGCAGPARTSRDLTGFAGIRRMVEERNAEVRALSGQGRISIDTPELGNTGGITVHVLKPDSLLIDITGPFGVGVARGLVTQSLFTFYNGLDNTVIQGATSAENLRRVLHFPIEFADVIEVLTGTVGFRSAPAAEPVLSAEGSSITATFRTANGQIEYVIDTDYEAITKYTRRNTGGEIVENITFKDFRKKSGVYVPTVVAIARPLAEESLTLVYERATINDTPIDFSFKVPRSATKISL